MKRKTILGIVVAIVVVMFAYLSIFTVNEGQLALVLRLGELNTNAKTNQVYIYAPGIHFKWPFISVVKWFDVRLQMLNVESSRILTEEQKYVIVDYYAKWRIINLPLYYKRTGGYPARAQMLLTQKINDGLRAAIGNHSIKEIISGERMNIMQLLQEKANEGARSLGIQVVDVRIQAIDLPQEVRESVYQRMRSEREQVAEKHRSQGKAQAETIRAGADAAVAVTIAQAKTQAQKIRAQGDARAAKIYTQAYSNSPKFYALYRSLEAYRQVFVNNKDTIMILKPDSEFFKYFNQRHNNNRQQ